jgi:hypothetical protein
MEMGLQYLRVSLRGYGGEAPTGGRFFTLFEPEPSLFGPEPWPGLRLLPSESAWQAALIELFAVDMRELSGFAEPSEEFAARTERGFVRAARWMSALGRRGLDGWRAEGRQADIAVSGWLANEQLDLHIPAEFLRECGRLDLPIRICTND